MRALIPVLLSVLMTVLLATLAYSGPFGLYGFLNVPTGDFGATSGDKAGAAKTGFAFGTELKLHIPAQGLFWAYDAMVMINSVDTAPFDESMLSLPDVVSGSTDVTSWVNIPLLTGLRYEAPASPEVKLYGVGLIGLDFARSPKIDWEGVITDGTTDYSVTITQESTVSTSFAFEVGGGLLIGDRFDVSLRYLNLDTPKFEVDTKAVVEGYPQSGKAKFEQSISTFLISAGVRF